MVDTGSAIKIKLKLLQFKWVFHLNLNLILPLRQTAPLWLVLKWNETIKFAAICCPCSLGKPSAKPPSAILAPALAALPTAPSVDSPRRLHPNWLSAAPGTPPPSDWPISEILTYYLLGSRSCEIKIYLRNLIQFNPVDDVFQLIVLHFQSILFYVAVYMGIMLKCMFIA